MACGIAAVLYLGIPGLALGQWFWQEGVAKLGATRAIKLYRIDSEKPNPIGV